MTTYLELPDALYVIRSRGLYVKDVGLLHSALARPGACAFGQDVYNTIELQGAALLESLLKGDWLVEGKKRAAWFLLTSFLFVNKFHIEIPTAQAMELIQGLETSELNLLDASEIIGSHLVEIV